ncbi:MAG TPA: ankyrin repeat domain-containing protein [Candidatus Megaira endosymbiont of Nemacystus decipiens]|nr:ankyrin repeat domain-containing protein [Candidatus Megaera endosymbiont of Nemacystus decipiens]
MPQENGNTLAKINNGDNLYSAIMNNKSIKLGNYEKLHVESYSNAKNGDTLLHAAARMADYDTAFYLVEMGAKINVHNRNSETPLDLVYSSYIEKCNEAINATETMINNKKIDQKQLDSYKDFKPNLGCFENILSGETTPNYYSSSETSDIN